MTFSLVDLKSTHRVVLPFLVRAILAEHGHNGSVVVRPGLARDAALGTTRRLLSQEIAPALKPGLAVLGARAEPRARGLTTTR